MRIAAENESLVLAVDVGTSSVRAMLFDQDGAALPGIAVQIPYAPLTTPDGGSEINAGVMLDLIFSAIDQVIALAGDSAKRIRRVAMDTLVGNAVGIDGSGQPVTPIYTWADRRGGEYAANLGDQLDRTAYSQRTGARIHTSYWPLRLIWLQQAEPDRMAKVRYWLTLGDLALYRLFGERRCSLSMASWTGLLNRHRNAWDDETIAHLPLRRDQLPTLSGEPFQGLSGAWAERWPDLKNALWFPPYGDGVASNVGAGCTTNAQVALNVGTSGAIRVIVPGRPPTPDGLFAYCVDERRSLIGGALSNAGNLYAWLNGVLKTPSPAELMAKVGAIGPDSHGLTVLPFLAGERAPGWNDKARAVFMGMTLDTAPEHLVRAALEAVAYRFYQIARRLAPIMAPDPIFIASGAAILNSPVWMQIVADVLDARVYANLETEATIRGAAVLPLGLDPAPRLGAEYLPDPGRHVRYMEAVARQEWLYQRVLGNQAPNVITITTDP